MPAIAPYGSWKSPITADLIVQDAVSLGAIQLDGDDVYWVETRAADSGRNVVVRRSPDGATRDVTPAPFNARTRVHEYGGLSFWVADGVVWFANFADQRVYRQEPDAAPVAITPEGVRPAFRRRDGGPPPGPLGVRARGPSRAGARGGQRRRGTGPGGRRRR